MKKKIMLLILFSFLLSGCSKEVVTVAGVLPEDGQNTDYIEMKEFRLKDQTEEKSGDEVSCCAVLIPTGYQESEEIPGMYVHERNPLDSSNVYYTVSEGNGDGRVSRELTKDSYREIESFEEIDMEGIPAYKIRSSYTVEDGEIEQLAYLILADDTYTVTYSQMSDDELMADFEISDGEIRLVREEEVSIAKE